MSDYLKLEKVLKCNLQSIYCGYVPMGCRSEESSEGTRGL